MTDNLVEVSPVAFASALANAANGVSIVTAAAGSSRAGLTVSSMCSVCAEPPIVLACVNADNEFCDLALDSERFAINILARHQQALSNRFAGLTPGVTDDDSEADRFDEGEWSIGIGGSPVLDDALVTLECALRASELHGTHRVFFGRVIRVHSRPGEPLVYTRRGYARTLADE